MKKRLDKIEADLPSSDPLKRLQLLQERLDLQQELAAARNGVDLSALEAEFVAASKRYGERRGISYAAWRAVGVPDAVLKKAGITRSA